MNNNEPVNTLTHQKPPYRVTQREIAYGQVAVGVSRELIALIDADAHANDRTRTWVVRNILRKYYESKGANLDQEKAA
jgi:hypothetical protein